MTWPVHSEFWQQFLWLGLKLKNTGINSKRCSDKLICTVHAQHPSRIAAHVLNWTPLTIWVILLSLLLIAKRFYIVLVQKVITTTLM